MFLPIILTLLPVALALPTSTLSRVQPTWLIAHFQTIVSPSNHTTVTFHFHDTDPFHKCDLICTTNSTSTSTQVCGPNRELLYKVTENEVVLRRKMHANSTNMGTARQGTNWVYGINLTETEMGTSYLREEDWLFPITSVSG